MKGARRKAREDALQILYQLDMNADLTPASGLAYFQKCFAEGREVDPFTQRLVSGVAEHLVPLDARIKKISENWRAERMSVVDRNLLRLGAYELEHCDDIPATVTINEAIELAKQFSAENSPAFINGILDKIKAGLTNPAKAP